MTAKKTTKKTRIVDLFDHALGIKGEPEPQLISVGDVELNLRRTHTGQQVVEWQRIEAERVSDAAEVLGDKSSSDEKKAETLRAVIRNYSRNMLRALTVDVEEKDIAAAAELIADLPADSRGEVFRQIGMLAGVVDEDGNPFRSGNSSKTGSATTN